MSWRVQKEYESNNLEMTEMVHGPVYTEMNRTYKVENYGTDPVVHIFSRNLEGKRVHHKKYGFPPYFYGGKESDTDLAWAAESTQPIVFDILGRQVVKVELILPKHTTAARKNYDYHCGANIYFEDRWYWDSGIRVTYSIDHEGEYTPIDPNTVPIVPRRILYFDIESLGPKEYFADETVPNVPVHMVQSLDSYSKEVWIYYVESPWWSDTVSDHVIWEGMALPTGVRWPYKIHFVRTGRGTEEWDKWDLEAKRAEVKLFEGFVGLCKRWDPDDFGGWNINNYDWQKLNARGSELGIKDTFRGVSPVNWHTIRGKRDDESRWGQKGSVKINGRTSVDMLELYKQQTKPDGEEPGYSLKEVLARRIGLVYDELGPQMQDNWHDVDGRQKLFRYGALDVIGPYLLNEGPEELQGKDSVSGGRYRCMKMWDQPEVVRRLSGCSFSDTFKKIRMLQPLLWRFMDKPIPTAKYGAPKSEEDVGGGAVFEPEIGLHMWTGVVDFSGMYPSIFIDYNMGKDTLLTEEQVNKLDNNQYVTVEYNFKGIRRTVYFDLRFDSSLRILGRHLVGLRETYRARGKELFKKYNAGEANYDDWYFNHLFEINAKFMANSIYGVNNYSGWPLYCPPVANAITGVGRDVLEWVAKRIQEEFPWIKVVYGDTDSVFLKVEADSKTQALTRLTLATARINELLLEKSQALGLQSPMNVKLEKIFNPIVFKGDFTIYKSGKVKFKRGTKKRYMALEVHKDGEDRDKVVFVGLEAKRSDASPYVQKLQMKVGEILLRDFDTKAYVENLRERYKSLKSVELNELAVPRGLSKHPTKYRPDAWTKAVMYAMRVFDQAWIQQIKPRIVYIKPLRIGKRKYRLTVPKVWKWKCVDRKCKAGDWFTKDEIPERFDCLVCKGPATVEAYKLETVTSLTGDMDDIPDDFWAEWEVDYDKMREKILKNKFADMCLSIGEQWSHVEGHTTLDQFFT